MNQSVRQLRTIQLLCIAAVLGYIWLTLNVLKPDNHPGFFRLHYWLIVVFAAWSAISGFTVQRSVLRRRRPKSTPLGRWKLGHIVRLVMAVTVAIWAVLLHIEGGPFKWVATLYASSLLLLAIWRPGDVPAATQEDAR